MGDLSPITVLSEMDCDGDTGNKNDMLESPSSDDISGKLSSNGSSLSETNRNNSFDESNGNGELGACSDASPDNSDYQISRTPSLNDEEVVVNPKKRLCLEDQVDLISLLSDEILLYILSLVRPRNDLAKVARTCHRLARLCRDDSLWSRVDVAYSTLKPDSVYHILSKGVRSLRMNTTTIRSPMFSEVSMTRIAMIESWKVEYLDLSNAHISAIDLELILRQSKCLVKLSLEDCDLSLSGKWIVNSAKTLDTLNLTMSTGLTVTDMRAIAVNCKRLKELNVSWCGLSNDAVATFCRQAPPSLLKVNLAGAVKSLNNHDVESLTSRCYRLSELDFSDCFRIGPSALQSIASNLPQSIESISLSRCYKIRMSDIMELKCCKRLKRLNLFGNMLSEDQWETVKTALPSLIHSNQDMMSSIARPTVGHRRTSIWGIPCRVD